MSMALKEAGIDELLIDTGQHYDDNMAGAFYRELTLPSPALNLGVGSGTHAQMTARIMCGAERILQDTKPKLVLVYGDTNSTMAAALAAVKHGIPVAHIEAGLRSFRLDMPEEVNRRVTDHISTLLLCPTANAVINLMNEGLAPQGAATHCASMDECRTLRPNSQRMVANVGDVMVDAIVDAEGRGSEPEWAGRLRRHQFALLTLHRADSTDNVDTLSYLVEQVIDLSRNLDVLFPIHPRTRARLKALGLLETLENTQGMLCVAPLPYLSFIQAQKRAAIVITDSGGVQKEAFTLATPCLTLRDETEWTETLVGGWNQLIGTRPSSLRDAVARSEKPAGDATTPFGDGKASQRMAAIIKQYLDQYAQH